MEIFHSAVWPNSECSNYCQLRETRPTPLILQIGRFFVRNYEKVIAVNGIP